MTGITPKQLARLIQNSDTTPAELAKAIGRGPDYVRDFLVGRKKSLKADDWAAIKNQLNIINDDISAPTLVGLPVVGIVEAGNFRDISLDQPDEYDYPIITVAKDQRFGSCTQYALKVSGDSMNKEFVEGSFVTCVSWGETGLDLQNGMMLHVERTKAAILTETTVKFFQEIDGKHWLIPSSINPVHKPIEISGGTDTEIVIKGLVTGSWKPTTW